jgi:hypothetical protein
MRMTENIELQQYFHQVSNNNSSSNKKNNGPGLLGEH